MFLSTLFGFRWAWIFFLFVSFWPWEKDGREVKKTSFPLPADSRLLKTVKVAVFYEKRRFLISVPDSFEIERMSDDQTLNKGSLLQATPVRPDPSGIRFGSELYPVSGLRITSRGKEIEVDHQRYRDAIQVLKNPGGSLTVVNEIDVEAYLKGVLPKEMHVDWPEEALKAQAVASRTYALFKNIENKDFPFALSSDVGSQVYGGKAIEHSATNRAVERTRGEILTYNSRIFSAYFHSSCGGKTARADYQWNVESHPSLKGVECSFCRGSRHDKWRAEYKAQAVKQLLARKGHSVSEIQALTPDEEDQSERPRFIEIRHGGGKLELSANQFRLAVGPDRLKSTKFHIRRVGERFIFEGRGWGHGVGLCQYGAKRLAELGYRYPDILRYYYPESTIQNVEVWAGPASGFSPPGEAGQERGGVTGWFRKVKNYIEDL